MNWDAIGAIAELLGAIGVIASLIYLATQLRQNTRALKAGTYQQFNDSFTDMTNSAITTPGLARIVRSAMSDYEGLDDEGAFVFAFWIHNLMHGYDNLCYQHRMGMLDDERWEMHSADIANFFNAPGIVMWWRTEHGIRGGTAPGRGGGVSYSPAFVALVEEILGEEAESADPPQ